MTGREFPCQEFESGQGKTRPVCMECRRLADTVRGSATVPAWKGKVCIWSSGDPLMVLLPGPLLFLWGIMGLVRLGFCPQSYV